MTVFNEADLTRLETLLTPLSQAGTTMRPDEVQGFFTALACGPDRLGVDEWLDDVLGDAPAFESAETEAEIRALLQKFYDSVAAALAEGELPELVLYSADDSDEPDFRPWCNAYMYALDVVPTDWFEAADDEGFEERRAADAGNGAGWHVRRRRRRSAADAVQCQRAGKLQGRAGRRRGGRA